MEGDPAVGRARSPTSGPRVGPSGGSRSQPGGSIQARSADNPDSLRGATLDGLVFDEAAQAKPEAWPILRPTLSVNRGWAMFISTPKGLNWFHDLYQEADSRDNWSRWRFPSVDSPYLDKDEIETARLDMSSLVFSQEYEAEFIAGGESQFRTDWIQHYRTNLTDDERYFVLGDEVVALSDCSTFHTVDLAWSLAEDADFTVISTWAVTQKKHLLLLDVLARALRGAGHRAENAPRLRPIRRGARRGAGDAADVDHPRGRAHRAADP